MRVWTRVCNDDGATALEYAFLLALIGLAIAAAAGAIGNGLSTFFEAVPEGWL